MMDILRLKGVDQILDERGYRHQPLIVGVRKLQCLSYLTAKTGIAHCSRFVNTTHFKNICQIAARRTIVLLLSHPLGS